MHYTKVLWRDGQPYSEMYDDIYCSSNDGPGGGEQEFYHVFLLHNGLPQRWHNQQNFVIAELGFGSGLNCLLTMREWLKHLGHNTTDKCLHYIAIEKHPLSALTIKKIIEAYPELKTICDELLASYPPPLAGSHSRCLFDGRVRLHYRFMDADRALTDENFKVDAWYLDGFSPAKNADMWSQSLCLKIAQNSHEGTTCSTYSAAGLVRRNLQNAGFTLQKTAGYGKKREMLTGRFSANKNIAFSYADRPWYVRALPPLYSIKKATVIGAGIAGLTIAHALSRRGWSIDIIDRQTDIAGETSANPAAIIYPRLSLDNDQDTDFYLAAYSYCLQQLKTLQQKHHSRFWFDTGLRQVMDKKRLSAIIDKFDFDADYIDGSQDFTAGAGTQAPVIDHGQPACLDYKNAGVVMPRLLCQALQQECGNRLKLITARISKVAYENGRWLCFAADQLITDNELLIIANGIGVDELLSTTGGAIDAVRGQVLELKANAASESIRETVNSGFYITPAIDGKHYLGASYSRENKSLLIDDADSKALLGSLQKLYPGVFAQQDCLAAWVGLRAVSKDRVPLVGAVPDEVFFHQQYADICHGRSSSRYQPAAYLNGLYLSAGHGSRGFTTSFISAEVIAALINDEPLPVSKKVMDYISPSRFVVNDLKRR